MVPALRFSLNSATVVPGRTPRITRASFGACRTYHASILPTPSGSYRWA